MTNVFAGGARLGRTVEIAADFLAEENIRYFPLEPENIILGRGWTLCPYTRAGRGEGVDGDVGMKWFAKNLLGMEDAVVLWRRGRYAIGYNDSVRSPGRIHFSLMHEVGHIVLGHFQDAPAGSLRGMDMDDPVYLTMEEEANAFARNTLAPAVLARQFRARFPAEACAAIFGMSKAAWETRLHFLRADERAMPKAVKERQVRRFWDFVTCKTCLACGGRVAGLPKGSHCPFCGKDAFYWQEDTLKDGNIYRPEAYACPVGNGDAPTGINGEQESTEPERGWYPDGRQWGRPFTGPVWKPTQSAGENHCGSPANCGKPAGEADRYCCRCGSETTALREGRLLPVTPAPRPGAARLVKTPLPF